MTPDTRPGLDARRLVRLMSDAIGRCGLDLSGLTVLTEAATGAYVVTPVLAAMAGADVYALAAQTPYASSEQIRALTTELARLGEVTDNIRLIDSKDPAIIGTADIVTNSGQVRPIDADMVAHMKASAAVPLMYESWEYRAADVDLRACRARNIVVAGTNERHPDVDVFSFLGQMAVMQLHDAGVAVRGSRILLLCDNEFAPFIVRDLKNAGAEVAEARQFHAEALPPLCDAVILAMSPREEAIVGAAEAALLGRMAPGTILVQYWGDVDRAALAAAAVPVWPRQEPRAGHMGILPSAIGPEPIIRLQAGGLKVGQILARGLDQASSADLDYIQVLLWLRMIANCFRRNDVDRILLLGMGPTSMSALESLAERFHVVGIVRAAPSPEGGDEVTERAHTLSVPVFSDLTPAGVDLAIAEARPDCTVVSSYNRILPSRILNRGRFVNVHYAPLPEYRGRANVNWALINGESHTAITIHVMVPGLDSGNVLYQQRIPIGPDDTITDLYARLNDVQRAVLAETVARYLDGYPGEAQDEAAATYGCTRVPDDGEIDWSDSSQRIYGLIRALAPPYPGAHTYLDTRRVTILRAAPIPDPPRYAGRIPGRVVGRSQSEGYADVLTGDGVLRIHELATADNIAGPASRLITSTRQTLGLRASDLLARIESLESLLDRQPPSDP